MLQSGKNETLVSKPFDALDSHLFTGENMSSFLDLGEGSLAEDVTEPIVPYSLRELEAYEVRLRVDDGHGQRRQIGDIGLGESIGKEVLASVCHDRRRRRRRQRVR